MKTMYKFSHIAVRKVYNTAYNSTLFTASELV